MKIIFRVFALLGLVLIVSCGKKKCNTCPDWGKAEVKVEQVEEA